MGSDASPLRGMTDVGGATVVSPIRLALLSDARKRPTGHVGAESLRVPGPLARQRLRVGRQRDLF